MGVNFGKAGMFGGFGAPWRTEADIRDCEVDGEIPAGLDGAFYRVGPDFQYPPVPGNVPFDGEGHLSMFRFANGRVDFRSRYVRTQRWKAQDAARRRLFGMYRNPLTDEPEAKGLSRGTANTTPVFHHGRLFSLKEDSPPVALDPNTLETLDDCYTFGGKLTSRTFTAHPKFDPATGEMLAFGYEARGENTDDVAVYAIDRDGHITWEAWIKVPYAGMIHDFAVTQTHIAFLVIPMWTDVEQMKRGGPHFSWNTQLPSWFGVMRRGGDGKDLRWFKGPERCATHVMGAFSDGDRIFVDMDMGLSNQFPFFPFTHGEHYDRAKAEGHITRVSVDLSDRRTETFGLEVLFPGHAGILPRQDDRYQTVPYRIGFMPTIDASRPLNEKLANAPTRPVNCWTRFDIQTGATATYFTGDACSLQEPTFAPRSATAPEGDGWLVGIQNALLENRSNLVIVDARHPDEGAIATVRLPFKLNTGIHGWWVPGSHLKPV